LRILKEKLILKVHLVFSKVGFGNLLELKPWRKKSGISLWTFSKVQLQFRHHICKPNRASHGIWFAWRKHVFKLMQVFSNDILTKKLKGWPGASGSACRLWTERSQVRAVASTHCTMCGKDLPLITSPRPCSAGAYNTGYVLFFILTKKFWAAHKSRRALLDFEETLL